MVRPPSSVLSVSDDDSEDRYNPHRGGEESSVSTYNGSDVGAYLKGSLTNLSTASTKILDNTMKTRVDEAATKTASSPTGSSTSISRNSIAASRLLRARQQRPKKQPQQQFHSPDHTTSAADSRAPASAAPAEDDVSLAGSTSTGESTRRRTAPSATFHATFSPSRRGIPSPPESAMTTPKKAGGKGSKVVTTTATDGTPRKTNKAKSPLAPNTQTLASSASARRVLRTRAKQSRTRNVGLGKLVGKPKEELDQTYSFGARSDCTDDEDEEGNKIRPNLGELDAERERTRNEFSQGTAENSRYRDSEEKHGEDDCNQAVSEASMPSMLQRSDVFHENATAAVLALLTPRAPVPRPGGLSDGFSVTSSPAAAVTVPPGRDNNSSIPNSYSLTDRSTSTAAAAASAGIRVESTEKGIVIKSPARENLAPFQPPKAGINDNMSMVSVFENNFDNMPKSPSKPLLSEEAEKTLEKVKQKMKPAPKQLADLLAAISSPDNHEDMDRGFMVRRKNACGALKVLTLNDRNRRTMCWTVGVLTALTSVLEDTGDEGLLDAFPDEPTRREYKEARTRAVTCILNLATFKENRVPMFLSNGLMQAIIKVIFDDNGESRKGCCATVAYLAKQPENRLLMVQVPGFIDALCTVIKPVGGSPEQITKSKRNHQRGDQDDDCDDDKGHRDGMRDDDSDATEARTTSPKSAAQKASNRYDNDPNVCIHASRQSVFATLLHLIKEKDNAYSLARHMRLIEILVDISALRNSPSHLYAVRMLANLTRHRENSKLIVSNIKIVVPALVNATSSPTPDSRLFACYAIQNLSQEKSCRQEVASTKGLVLALCLRARQSPFDQEKLASISALKNLTDEPANLIPMTNTPECFATLMQIAHGNDPNISDLMQYLACDALATLSHWLRKIASSGEMAEKKPASNKKEKMFIPTLKPITFQQWA